MSEVKIKKQYLDKVELINHYNKKYFDENISEISDADYDLLKKDIILLEKKYSFLKHKDSPSKKVGHKPSKIFRKISHRVPMLSLGNAFSEEDLVNFEKKILNFLSRNNNSHISYSAEPKIDGISASLTYLNGKLKSYPSYNELIYINKNLYKTTKKTLYGLVDSNGNYILDVKYEKIKINKNIIQTISHGEIHYYDLSGHLIF